MALANPNSALNVFVTGATTPAGREITRQLSARGHKVTGQTTHGSVGATQVRQDGGIPAFSDLYRLGELKSMLRSAQAEVVIHAATQAFNTFPHARMAWDNRLLREGTLALVEAAADLGVKFLVHLSSVFLYGDQHGEWVDESSPRHEERAFVAGVTAEEYVLGHALPACVLRAGILYGPHDEGTRRLADSLRRGRGVYLGDDHHVANWIHMTDLARAVVLAVEHMPPDQVFNVVDDQPVSASAFAAYMASNLGLPAPGAPPRFLLNLMTGDMQRLLLATSIRAHNDRIKQQLGWTPRYPTYRAGIDQTLLVWRAEEPVSA